jgi:hypothetical protein
MLFHVVARVESVGVIFAIVIALLAAEMIFNGLTGKLS